MYAGEYISVPTCPPYITTNTTILICESCKLSYVHNIVIDTDGRHCGLVVLGSIPGGTIFSEWQWIWNGAHLASWG
jgi:hypothetical protein